eukprot:74868-Amphidinium_carterae.1
MANFRRTEHLHNIANTNAFVLQREEVIKVCSLWVALSVHVVHLHQRVFHLLQHRLDHIREFGLQAKPCNRLADVQACSSLRCPCGRFHRRHATHNSYELTLVQALTTVQEVRTGCTVRSARFHLDNCTVEARVQWQGLINDERQSTVVWIALVRLLDVAEVRLPHHLLSCCKPLDAIIDGGTINDQASQAILRPALAQEVVVDALLES